MTLEAQSWKQGSSAATSSVPVPSGPFPTLSQHPLAYGLNGPPRTGCIHVDWDATNYANHDSQDVGAA